LSTNATALFLLSPANCGGKRARLLLRPEASFELAERLRGPGGAPLGEVFSFMSGLYFRGKLAYARAFADPFPGLPGALVITSGAGLVDAEAHVGVRDLEEFAGVPIDPADSRYREPLLEDLRRIASFLPPDRRIVLLGSIATAKYVELLLGELGDRLCFPEAFAGMGDMQRGALMLRAAREGRELSYVRAAGAVRSHARARTRARS
jgi:hypothetical protein